MNSKARVEFLERASYRQRRFRDAARLLPFLALVLMFLPLMWPRDTPDQSLTSAGMIYLFGLWCVLIGVSFVLSRLIQPAGDDEAGDGSGEGGAGTGSDGR